MKRKRESNGSKTSKRPKKKSKMPSDWAGPALSSLRELKAVDVPATNLAVTTGTAQLVLLNGTAVGDEYNTRDGRRMHMTKLYIRGHVNAPNTVGAVGSARLLVVYDKQTNAAAPVVTDILNTDNVASHLNLNNRSRFQVLVDEIYPIGFQGNYSQKLQVFRKLNLDVQFLGTGATVASISTGSIYAVFLTDVGATNITNFTYSSRIRFLDF